MLDLIICANFGVEKLRGLGNTRGQILEFPIEMAGHLYNRAGATAQPVIRNKRTKKDSVLKSLITDHIFAKTVWNTKRQFSAYSCLIQTVSHINEVK